MIKITIPAAFIFLFLIFSGQLDASNSRSQKAFNTTYRALDNRSDSAEITRIIDVSKDLRVFPDLVAYRNTSVQKAPAPIIGKIAEESFGKAKITRCWLNLDEMWDYRTRQFNFDFKIGVDKYKDVTEKHRETWDSEVESPITFYEYIKAFSGHSDAIMLTIRRYERDILDKKLPITMEDWKMIFKEGLKHYKKLFPNIRYVEVCNEYELKGFIGATDEQYYQFYRLGYEAVNEINEELGLDDDNRILVGGPVVTGSFDRLNHFFEFFSKDQAAGKRLDFVAWHEYHFDIPKTANRENEIKQMLTAHSLSKDIPMFITEHDPFHFSEDKLEYHYLNAAYLPKSLYFSSINNPDIKIFPWVMYHRKEIQTKFMWFSGPNETKTKEDEIKMLPLGCSVKFLSMLKGKEIRVDNSIEGNDLVLASFGKNRLVIETINYGDNRNVKLNVTTLESAFPGLKNGKLHVVKYLIDSTHSNCLTKTDYKGGIEKVEDFSINATNGEIILKHDGLEKNGLILWEINK